MAGPCSPGIQLLAVTTYSTLLPDIPPEARSYPEPQYPHSSGATVVKAGLTADPFCGAHDNEFTGNLLRGGNIPITNNYHRDPSPIVPAQYIPTSPFLFFSLVTTVMDMVGVAAASPLLGNLLTWRDRKVHLSVFLVVGRSFFSASLFLSAGCAAVQ